MTEKLKKIYRKLFYHWREKYLCPLGFHDHGTADLDIATTYICTECYYCIENKKVIKRQRILLERLKTAFDTKGPMNTVTVESTTDRTQRKGELMLGKWMFKLGIVPLYFGPRTMYMLHFGLFKITEFPLEGDMITTRQYRGFWLRKQFFIRGFEINL